MLSHKNTKKILEELSWDDDVMDDVAESPEDIQNEIVMDKQQLKSHDKADNTIKSLNFIENLDKKFDNLFKEVLDKDNDVHLFSAKVQRFELNSLPDLYKEKVTKEDTETQDDTDYKKIQEDLQKLFNNESNDILKIFQNENIHNARKDYYEMYDEIASINFIAYRMLRVYLDNILIKHMQTKQFINVVENENNMEAEKLDPELKNQMKKFIEMIITYFGIPTKLKNEVLPKTLKYGDYYIEIVNLSNTLSLIKNAPELLTESFEFGAQDPKTSEIKIQKFRNINFATFEYIPDLSKQSSNIHETSTYDMSDEELSPGEKLKRTMQKFQEKISRKRSLEESDISFLNLNQDLSLNDVVKMDYDCIENLYLRLLEPTQVIKVESDGILYGYLIIEDEKDKNKEDEEINLYKRFLSDNEGKNNDEKVQKAADILTDKVANKVLEIVRSDEEAIDNLDDNIKLSLKVIIYHKLKENSKLKFRYVEPSHISNFHTVIDKFAPYGTSIFDPIIQPVKMYTIGLMTSIISRLSRAAVVRKWNIEVGNKRNYTEIVEKVKKDLRNKSVTYNDLGNIKNISKIMTDFRDIATVTKDGQRFIDLEILPTHDRSLPIQELQDLRNELIMSTGIPSVYLNAADAVDLRETLVNLNINFANTIIGIQSLIEDALNDLLNSIFKKIIEMNGENANNFNITQYFKITMNPPLVLQLQSTEGLVTSVANILGVLNQAQLPVDPVVLLEKYIPSIDWRKLKESGEELIKDDVKKQLIQQMAQGQGGGF